MKSSLKILAINQFASTPKYSTGAGERLYYLSEFLHPKGIKITVLSAAYNHLFHRLPQTKGTFTKESTKNIIYYWVRLRKYNSLSGIQRTIAFFEFLIKLFFFKINQDEKPNLVLVSSMSILPVYYAAYLQWRFKIPFILEIRDIWPLTAIELGGYSPRHPFIKFLSFTEKFAYKKADYIVSVLPKFDEYLSENGFGNKKFKWIPNGISQSLEVVNSNNLGMNIDSNNFNVVYTGAIGLANAMDLLVRVAIQLENVYNLHFIIVGDGPEKEHLMKMSEGLSNVSFYNKVSKEEVHGILRQCHLGFISWRKRDIYKYGISANKYNDYMLAELPILSVSGLSSDPVLRSNCGIMINADDHEATANAIMKLYNMSKEQMKKFGNNGKKYLIENQSYQKLAGEYMKVLKDLERE